MKASRYSLEMVSFVPLSLSVSLFPPPFPPSPLPPLPPPPPPPPPPVPPTDPPTSSYAEDVEGWQCVRVLVKIEAGGMQVQDFQGRTPTSVPRRRL